MRDDSAAPQPAREPASHAERPSASSIKLQQATRPNAWVTAAGVPWGAAGGQGANPINPIAAWLALIRPQALPLALGPALVTLVFLAASGARLDLVAAALTLLAITLLFTGATLLDEYLEFARAATGRRVAGGGYAYNNALVGAAVNPLDTLRASAALLGLGALAGALLVRAGGWPLALLGLAGVTLAVLYSATSYALKRLPVGELAVFLTLGPGITLATTLAQGRPFTPPLALLGVALGLFAAALTVATHLRDRDADSAASRLTLVTLLGGAASRGLYVALLLAAYAFALLAALPLRAVSTGALLAFLSLPVAALPLTGALRATSANVLDLVVRQTLRTYLAFTLWLVIGFLVAGALFLLAS